MDSVVTAADVATPTGVAWGIGGLRLFPRPVGFYKVGQNVLFADAIAWRWIRDGLLRGGGEQLVQVDGGGIFRLRLLVLRHVRCQWRILQTAPELDAPLLYIVRRRCHVLLRLLTLNGAPRPHLVILPQHLESHAAVLPQAVGDLLRLALVLGQHVAAAQRVPPVVHEHPTSTVPEGTEPGVRPLVEGAVPRRHLVAQEAVLGGRLVVEVETVLVQAGGVVNEGVAVLRGAEAGSRIKRRIRDDFSRWPL